MHHLAQVNIARFKAPITDPIMKEFTEFLEPVNKLAEESKGFVWRFTDQEGRSSSYATSLLDDEMIAINFSVWEDLPSLHNFVYHTVHSYFLKNKKKWFDPTVSSTYILWWIPKGQIPSIDMIQEKLTKHKISGDCPEVFSPKQMFDAAGNLIKRT